MRTAKRIPPTVLAFVVLLGAAVLSAAAAPVADGDGGCPDPALGQAHSALEGAYALIQSAEHPAPSAEYTARVRDTLAQVRRAVRGLQGVQLAAEAACPSDG